jgi:hypothetical protein
MPVSAIFWVAVSFAFPPLFARFVVRARGTRFFSSWAFAGFCAAGTGSLGALVGGGWPNIAGFGASGLLGLVLWWNSRRKGRRKALRLLGGKARAVLAAMARNMPRLSPRLVPQGARA